MSDYYNQLEKANYAAAGQLGNALSPRPISLSEQISHELQYARENVQRLERLTELLKEHPGVEEILALMGRR